MHQLKWVPHTKALQNSQYAYCTCGTLISEGTWWVSKSSVGGGYFYPDGDDPEELFKEHLLNHDTHNKA